MNKKNCSNELKRFQNLLLSSLWYVGAARRGETTGGESKYIYKSSEKDREWSEQKMQGVGKLRRRLR